MSCFDCARGDECVHFAPCNNQTGVCECPTGFGGQNCAQPVCGSLADPNMRRPLRPANSSCACTNDFAGVNCNLCTSDASCAPFMPAGSSQDARCYAGGELVKQNFHMCEVTNKKLLDILAGRKAEVSFECTRETANCAFQLWVDEIESFFCDFSRCDFDGLKYHCADVTCRCRPGELLCGKEGSLDLSEWLEKSVAGPGDLNCDTDGRCSFMEPEMNKLIKYVLGDPSIELQCASGECLHYSQLPDYESPANNGASLGLCVASAVLAFALLCAVWRLFARTQRPNSASADAGVSGIARGAALAAESADLGAASDLTDSSSALSAPAAGIYFESVSYATPGRQILAGVSGACPAGSVLAILGGSGAGKTTLLDILAGKHKLGAVRGDVRLDGLPIAPGLASRSLLGFVDQSDDILVPTQSVYEHVLFSALLRLPRSMSRAAKELRVLETLAELKIDHLRHQLVGSGLSGGEKRRVVIACELVTSPSVLLLDEPTSGLDAFNAFSVVENLVALAKDRNRTIVFTIHQPRSNIVQLFDRVLLLAGGKTVFMGNLKDARVFFEQAGHTCPPEYNFADFMIDVSMRAAESLPFTDAVPGSPVSDVLSAGSEAEIEGVVGGEIDEDAAVEEGMAGRGLGVDAINNDEGCVPEVHTMPLDVEPEQQWQDLAFHRSQISRRAARAMIDSQQHGWEPTAPDGLDPLTDAFRSSVYHADLMLEIDASRNLELILPQAVGASRRQQFVIIAQRIVRNLHRDPMLVLSHYGIAAALGVLCGYLYFHVSNDIPGFQNRLGLFFFLLAVFGFSTLSSISLFTRERLMFMRERANGYYDPLAYYSAKVLLDTVPLRVGPPLLLGLVLYPLVGLNMQEPRAPMVFLAVLTLFNLSAASLMLVVGTVFADFAVASLVGCMINLFGILFAGLFLNQESMPTGSSWAKWLSIYHYAYEALSVNEVKYLTLTEEKFGLKIEVPGATILSAFGFDNGSLVRNMLGLASAAVLSVVVGYACLHKILIERR